MGCWNDSNFGAMEHYGGNEFSISTCISYCGAMDYSYAGIQFAYHCFCGNHYSSFGQADESDCSLKCIVGTGLCGGIDKLSVWSVGLDGVTMNPAPGPTPNTAGDSPSPTPVPPTEPAVTTDGDIRYIGCYIDARERAMEPAPGNRYSIKHCIALCRTRNYAFAGLQFYDQCSCGNSYDMHGAAAESDCNTECRYGSGMCGRYYMLLSDALVSIATC